jgi:hypothetical protein
VTPKSGIGQAGFTGFSSNFGGVNSRKLELAIIQSLGHRPDDADGSPRACARTADLQLTEETKQMNYFVLLTMYENMHWITGPKRPLMGEVIHGGG